MLFKNLAMHFYYECVLLGVSKDQFRRCASVVLSLLQKLSSTKARQKYGV